jgi:hypothetical protein
MISVRLTVRVRPALLADATMVYVPAGVMGIGVGFGFEPLPNGIARPAPHPLAVIRHPSSAKQTRLDLRVLRKASKPIGNRVASQNILDRFIVCRFIVGREKSAVDETPVRTVTEIVVVLPKATLEGVTLHVEFAGNPVQVKIAVPGMFAAELSSNG